MCLLVTALTLPLAIFLPCAPIFIMINIGARIIMVAVLLLFCPIMLIPPCTCIYPIIALILFIRTGDMPTDSEMSKIAEYFSTNEGDFSSFFGDLSNLSSKDLSLYMEENEGTRRHLEAKASCKISLETTNTGLFHNEDMEPQEKISAVFEKSINEILSDESLLIDTDVTSTNPLLLQDESSPIFDINFTLSKKFSCNHNDETDCDTTLERAQEFLQETKASLSFKGDEENTNKLGEALMKHGSIIEGKAKVKNISCDSIGTKFFSD